VKVLFLFSEKPLNDYRARIYRKTLLFLKSEFPDSLEGSLSEAQLVDNVRRTGTNVVIAEAGLSVQAALSLRGMGVVTVLVGNDTPDQEIGDIVDIFIEPTEPERLGKFFGAKYLIDSATQDEDIEALAKQWGKSVETVRQGIAINEAKYDLVQIVSLFTKLKWDSEFFGVDVGLVSCQRLTPNIQGLVSDFVRRERIETLEYLCDCHDKISIKTAEASGYSFVDIRLTFERNLAGFNPTEGNRPGYRFAIGTKADIPRLVDIASNQYGHSRYYFDGNFDKQKVIDFYRSWVEKAILGTFDSFSFVLYEGDNPIGFCTIREYKSHAAQIGLVGLDPAKRGSGLAFHLLENSLRELKERGVNQLQVVTQGRNYEAQRLYQRVGFVTRNVQLWYHKWFR
jgi:ribosomal protein S18 acetylase RimI-like enzyme